MLVFLRLARKYGRIKEVIFLIIIFMAEQVTHSPDYKEDLQVLREATNKIGDKTKKTEIESKIAGLNQRIAAWETEATVRGSINDLKSELKLSEETPPSSWFQRFKATIETQSRETLTVQYINTLFEKLPTIEQDPVGRSFVLQFLWGKLRASGYLMTIENNRVSLRTRKQNDMNLAPFTETINNHIKAGQISLSECTQTVIIWSGTMGEYIEMNKINPDNINNADYILYLKKKYKLPENFIADDIKEKNIPDTDKALLFSSLNNGLGWVDMQQVVKNYDNMQKDAKELFDSQAYRQAQKVVDTLAGWKNKTPENTKDLAKQFTEDPAWALSGKPLTAIGAWIALIYGLGHKKGEWFSLWTGLTRGFMGLIALFLGNGIAKEWGMDPKELMKEGMNAMRDGGKEKEDPGTTPSVATDSEKPTSVTLPLVEKPKLSPGQGEATKNVMENKKLSQSITRHSESHKWEPGSWTLDMYLSFINSSDFQAQKLKNIIYTDDPEASIFDEGTGKLGLGITVPNELDHKILKKILRAYLTGNPEINYIEWNKWKKEQELFESWKPGIKDQKEMIIADALSKIYIP